MHFSKKGKLHSYSNDTFKPLFRERPECVGVSKKIILKSFVFRSRNICLRWHKRQVGKMNDEPLSILRDILGSDPLIVCSLADDMPSNESCLHPCGTLSPPLFPLLQRATNERDATCQPLYRSACWVSERFDLKYVLLPVEGKGGVGRDKKVPNTFRESVAKRRAAVPPSALACSSFFVTESCILCTEWQ